ncbi:HRAS-like suppressor 3 [Denticeps clupeoides]|uniref:LRAT domain-containing protein n=1 Tax=Denticeps clupeoides TaxID=299321 RepID=A0A8C3ZND8_9TELE|nr:HRAS-like suppressor 3 [Denticeps clupeoides]XP_028816298.1 HRAS-like suppressor 3 [Denticeps clupeoides]XP_028816496.1 HRAS-like suppressor 3 [Denticeps clupeoides]
MPQPADLIEIEKGVYQHWAMYVGAGYVIHLTTGGRSSLSGNGNKGLVRKEKLGDVVGNHTYHVNNILDHKFRVRPIRLILQEAEKRVNREMFYDVFMANCEHFVTELRYGEPRSRQAVGAMALADPVLTSAAVLAVSTAVVAEAPLLVLVAGGAAAVKGLFWLKRKIENN